MITRQRAHDKLQQQIAASSAKIGKIRAKMVTKKWWQSRIIITALFMLGFALLDTFGQINPILVKLVGLTQAVGSVLIIWLRKHTHASIS